MFNSKLFFLVFKMYYNVNFNIEPNLLKKNDLKLLYLTIKNVNEINFI